MLFWLLFALGITAALTACDDWNPWPHSRSVELEMRLMTAAKEWDSVATVHGYWDNYEACQDIAKGLNILAREKRGGTGREYRCTVNRWW